MNRYRQHKPKIIDGAIGTNLKAFPDGLIEELNITNPALVINLHKQYLAIHVDYLTTNSFNINNKTKYSINELVKASVENANKANVNHKAKILFSIGPAKSQEEYLLIIKAAAKLKFDYYLLETMIDLDEVKKIMELIKQYDHRAIFLSFVVKDKKLLDGNALTSLFSNIAFSQVKVLGINCIDKYEDIKYALDTFKNNINLPILVMPNSGNPCNGFYQFDEELFIKLSKLDYDLIDGCCGIGVNELKKIIDINNINDDLK